MRKSIRLRFAKVGPLCVAVALCACDGGTSSSSSERVSSRELPAASAVDASLLPVHRFANTVNGAYFYTASEAEKEAILRERADMRYEGVAFAAHALAPAGPDFGVPVYRFANLATGGYFYTANPAERDLVQQTRPDMRFEGATFAAAGSGPSAAPVYRLANLANGAYLYTRDLAEVQAAQATGLWRDEGIAFREAATTWSTPVGVELSNTAASGAGSILFNRNGPVALARRDFGPSELLTADGGCTGLGTERLVVNRWNGAAWGADEVLWSRPAACSATSDWTSLLTWGTNERGDLFAMVWPGRAGPEVQWESGVTRVYRRLVGAAGWTDARFPLGKPALDVTFDRVKLAHNGDLRYVGWDLAVPQAGMERPWGFKLATNGWPAAAAQPDEAQTRDLQRLGGPKPSYWPGDSPQYSFNGMGEVLAMPNLSGQLQYTLFGASSGWTTPQYFADVREYGTYFGNRLSDAAPDGGVWAVLTIGTGDVGTAQIVARRFEPATGRWTEPFEVARGRGVLAHHIAQRADGAVSVNWGDGEGAFHERSWIPGKGWMPARTLMEPRTPNIEGWPRPVVRAIADDGRAIALFTHCVNVQIGPPNSGPSTGCTFRAKRLSDIASPAAQWSDAEVLGPVDTDNGRRRALVQELRFLASGEAVFAWRDENYPVQQAGRNSVIYTRTLPAPNAAAGP